MKNHKSCPTRSAPFPEVKRQCLKILRVKGIMVMDVAGIGIITGVMVVIVIILLVKIINLYHQKWDNCEEKFEIRKDVQLIIQRIQNIYIIGAA